MLPTNIYLLIISCIIFSLYLITKLLNYKQLKRENKDLRVDYKQLKRENENLIQQNFEYKIYKKDNTELQLQNIELETLKKCGYIYVGEVLIKINKKIKSFIKVGYCGKDSIEEFEDRIDNYLTMRKMGAIHYERINILCFYKYKQQEDEKQFHNKNKELNLDGVRNIIFNDNKKIGKYKGCKELYLSEDIKHIINKEYSQKHKFTSFSDNECNNIVDLTFSDTESDNDSTSSVNTDNITSNSNCSSSDED